MRSLARRCLLSGDALRGSPSRPLTSTTPTDVTGTRHSKTLLGCARVTARHKKATTRCWRRFANGFAQRKETVAISRRFKHASRQSGRRRRSRRRGWSYWTPRIHIRRRLQRVQRVLRQRASWSSKGTGPRISKNTVVFLARGWHQARRFKTGRARDFLAWKSIDDEHVILNLDGNQSRQAKTTREESDRVVNQRIPEAYQWLVVPMQEKPKDAPLKDVEWSGDEAVGTGCARAASFKEAEERRVSGDGSGRYPFANGTRTHPSMAWKSCCDQPTRR